MNRIYTMIVVAAFCFVGCSAPTESTPTKTPTANAASTVTPSPTSSSGRPKNGDYPAKGTVTKINTELGSVEMDHDEIVGVMPAMRMEFYVTDKKLLNGLKAGDRIDFTLRYKDGTEMVTAISK